MPGQPLLARRMPIAFRRQQGTQPLARLEARQHLLDAPTDDHRVRTGTRSEARRPELRLHAAAPRGATGAACDRVQRRVVGTRLADQIGFGVMTRIGIEHAIAIGEDHQQVGLDRLATSAARVSLSPKRISSVTTVSFSLMTGTTPRSMSVRNVLRALR